ncbi:MAG: PAS domain S-box protein [Desulfobacterales bacterium]|nr:PAS domain S-box protein [Desulfobacterales bacterium]
MKQSRSFFQILLWSAMVLVIFAVIATGILTNTTLRSVEKHLPSTLLTELHDLAIVLEDLAEIVSAAEITKVVPIPDNFTQLRNKVRTVYNGIVKLRNTYVFDNLIHASDFHAVVAPAIADLQIWLSEGVSGYGPETEMTIDIALSRISEAHQKARDQYYDSQITVQMMLNDQRNRLDQFLFSVNMLFLMTLIITIIMIFLLIRQHILQRREAEAQVERKRAEKSLRESEQRFRKLSEATFEAVIIHDEGVIIEANDQFYKMFGYLPDELAGVDAISLTTTKNSGNQIRKHIKSEDLGPYEVTGIKKDGSHFPMEIRAKTMAFSSKKVRMSAIRDLTNRKKYEDALRNSEEQLKSFLNSNPNPVVVYNSQGHPLYLNPAFTKVFGWTMEELKGEKIPFVPSDQEQITTEKIKKLFQTHKTISFNTRRLTKNGDIRDILISAAEIKGTEKEAAGMVVNLVDITEAKKLESKFQTVQRIESLGILAGGIAHDFNNILASIIGYTELALDKAKKEPQQHEHLQEVLVASSRAADLVKQILTFSRQVNQEQKPVQVKLLVKEALKLLRASIPSTIGIEQNIQSNALLMGDATQIHQVVMNLCTNASHSMRDKGGVLTVNLSDAELDSELISRHSDLSPGSYIMLTITDTGHGIPPEVLEKIFDPFFTTKEKGEGTGMGLSVVHGIVHSHGGTIYVYSEPGKGSTFEVFFPAIESLLTSWKKIDMPIPTGTERILFIDDEPTIANMGKQILESIGYEVVTRTSSIEALEYFKARPNNFDLVVTDMTMPKMTGEVLASELMKVRPDIPIILCTGFSARIDEQKAMAMGIRAFVSKPILKREIAETIRKVLGT